MEGDGARATARDDSTRKVAMLARETSAGAGAHRQVGPGCWAVARGQGTRDPAADVARLYPRAGGGTDPPAKLERVGPTAVADSRQSHREVGNHGVALGTAGTAVAEKAVVGDRVELPCPVT